MSRRHFLTCLPPVLLSAALAMPMAGAAEPAVQRMDARIPVWVPASGDSPAHRAELAGHVYRPQGQGPWGLIVLSHGKARVAAAAVPRAFFHESRLKRFINKR